MSTEGLSHASSMLKASKRHQLALDGCCSFGFTCVKMPEPEAVVDDEASPDHAGLYINSAPAFND
jgi:hypothetical protein